MQRTTRRSKLPLSKMFLNAVLDATASCREDAQPRMKISETDRFPSSSDSDLSLVGKRVLNDDDVVSISSDKSTNVSTSCKSSFAACSTKAHYPVAYFRILVEDASDRLEEALKFCHKTGSYSFKFEFYIKILNDLCEELSNPPQHMEVEECNNVSQLREHLRQLQLNLVNRRNLFLSHASDQSRKLKISPPAGSKPYLEAAAEAKAARERQCKMVVLIEKIVNLNKEEEKCKQRRMKAETELRRYFDTLVQPNDHNREPKYEKFDPVDETASVGKESIHNDEFTSTNLFLKPSSPCIFCSELHWSHLCLKISTLEKRQRYFLEHYICPICGTSHKATCTSAVRFCDWPDCRARNSHHSALCPNVEYPITAEVISTYVRRLNDVNQIHGFSKVSEWLSTCKASSSPVATSTISSLSSVHD